MKPHIALREAIKAGEYDDNLNDVVGWVYNYAKRRGKLISEEMAEEFSVGDEVRTTSGFKPRYMNHLDGVITSIESDTLWVKLDTPVRRAKKTVGTIGVSARYVKPR